MKSFSFFRDSCIVLDKNSTTDSIVNATDSSMLWHSRLGHTSNKVLQQLCSQYNEISFDSIKPCDTCHYAKQKKLPFSLSTTVSSKFFDLIHVDIWDPYYVPSFEGHRYFLTVVDDFNIFTWIYVSRYSRLSFVLNICTKLAFYLWFFL